MKIKHITPRLIALLLAAFTVISLVACSSGDKSSSPSDSLAWGENSAGGMEGGMKDEAIAHDSTGQSYDRKIIRRVDMSCETKVFDDALSMIMATLSTYDGHVEASSINGTGYDTSRSTDNTYSQTQSPRRASLTLRVPAEKLDTFLETLRADEGIRIRSQTSTSDEITATYYDLKTRLDTLGAERDALMAMMEGFTDYKDISAMLMVQERLYDVIEEIEALQTRVNLYDDQVAMSTVTVNLAEVVTYTAPQNPTFGERIGRAFRDSWKDFADGCQDFAVFFVSALPTLLTFAVIVGGILCIILLSIRGGKKRKQNTPSDKS